MFPDFRWFAHYSRTLPTASTSPTARFNRCCWMRRARLPNHTTLRMVLRYLPLGLKVQAG